MMPESTSPVPAVASRASPVIVTSTSPAASATTVVGPLSSTTPPTSAANRRQAAMRSASGRCPVSRPYSPSCGVSTVASRRSRSTGAAPASDHDRAYSPSPSTSTGSSAAATSSRTAATVASSRPRPGPTTKAWKRSSPSSTVFAQPVSGTCCCTTSTGGSASMPGEDSVTIPLPARCAAADARWAEPVIPAEPATIRTPADHLCASRARGRSHDRTSAGSTTWAVAPLVSRPMSATSTVPAIVAPSPRTSPGLNAANVTVRDAASGRPRASPVRPSMPLGRSTARTGASPMAGADHVRLNPVP